ncbi:inositol monophosphatase [Nitzschia inconspicua]|uniref:3'(2'),5'-bisphosphate nucleotidase 1 n=1 Tax=Nitzschia inconspicua TaxID=303405 RepID=A0A9K3PQE4_9STRA|nr:inositol monophosphatase [Nitzschia inconspicua]
MILLSANSIMKTVSLAQLLSSCMDASKQGCDIIRIFQQQKREGDIQGTLKEGGNIRSVVTQADIDAQAKIVGGLRATWGNDLRIIGEEEEEEDNENNKTEQGTLLDKKLIADILYDEDIPMDEITIFVDPLDGTREFVEGRLQNVACLIGIARNQQPVAGVIGLPFPDGTAQSNAEIHYAIADQTNLFGVWPKKPTDDLSSAKKHHTHNSVTILTGDSNDPVLINATAVAKELASNHSHIIIGGTAAKLRLVASGIPNSVAILHFKTELWDTCAAQAVLQSQGGRITDLFGSPLVHSPTRPFGNIFGVVASSGNSAQAARVHQELCQRMRADNQSVQSIFGKWMGTNTNSPTMMEPQAIDIARDLDGIPFRLDYIQQVLRDENPNNLVLKSYSVPERDAWRGMMSNGVRFSLDWQAKKNPEDPVPPSDVFYKRIVMADLAHARDKLQSAPHKLIRDVKSYQVETSFLTSKTCRLLSNEAKMNVNKVFASDLRPMPADLGPKGQLQSRFSIFLEYFQESEGWNHQWLLDEEATKATLVELAKMHAYFWKGSQFWKKENGNLGKELESIVWQNGGYMQPKLQGKEQLEKVHSGWEARYPTFRNDLAEVKELKGVDLASLGKRLEAVASYVGEQAHPFSEENDTSDKFLKYRTFIHGDPKQANFFFRRNSNSGLLEVGIIDFQWSGFGLAATDVAHHIASAVMPDCLSYDGKKEAKLLDHYHSWLTTYMIEFGVAASKAEVEQSIFPKAILQRQYEVALLDVCRMVFAYAWSRWKPETEPTPESLNRNAYNKSLPNVLWLISRCHALLESIIQPVYGARPLKRVCKTFENTLLHQIIDRNDFLLGILGIVSSPKIVAAAERLQPSLDIESSDDICQNGRLVEERAVPGAYSSVCMTLQERVVPLPKLQMRLQDDRIRSGSIIIQQQPAGSGATGMTVWNSGLLLARLLDDIVETFLANSESSDFWSCQDVMELGCGTGVASIASHLLGAKSVVATDGNEKVLELARKNISKNCVLPAQGLKAIEAKPLQWGLLNAMDYSEKASLVLGADLTYNAGSWRVLAETMVTVLSLDADARIIYLSLGHEGFNVNAELDGFLSVAKEVGLIPDSQFRGINLSLLLQNSLSSSEKRLLDQSGGARVVVLKRRMILSKG